MTVIERPKSLTAIATERLKGLIVDGTFGLGALLSEKQIADMLGTSKTPVREAFAQLQTIGLIEVIPQKGGRVFCPDADQVRELCEVRFELESTALRFSMLRDCESLTARLTEICQEMTEVFDPNNSVPYQRLDSAFHQSLFRFCGNSLLAKTYDIFNPRICALRTHLTAPQVYLLTRSLEEHRILAEYAKSGDIASALMLLREHINRTRDYCSAVLTSGPGVSFDLKVEV